ncbi:DUF4118 domain-containing protein [Mycobacterium tilburgii]|uniref:DUF4118 domain-containing protein n=1 Tax=Mycobacterium tilburgii TaxID=44467 RepID=UPI001183F62F|nr:DUF4118 domain-containing protein [Mycobacterium tilburgii]
MLLSGTLSPALAGLAVAIGCIAVETAVVLLLRKLAPDNAFGVLYLIAILIVAACRGPALTVATAALSVVAYNSFRSWPDYGMTVTQPQSWTVLFVFCCSMLGMGEFPSISTKLLSGGNGVCVKGAYCRCLLRETDLEAAQKRFSVARIKHGRR